MANNASSVLKTDLQQLFVDKSTSMDDQLWAIKGNGITGLFKLKHTLMKRPEVETNEDYVQVLPYVTISQRSTVAGNTVIKYLTYQRPNTGGEGQLHNKRSLGFGGHIEAVTPAGVNITARIFLTETIREIREELGLTLLDSQVAMAIQNTAYSFYQPQDPVGKFHLCVNTTIELMPIMQKIRANPQEAIALEWLTKDEILGRIANDPDYNMEEWSIIALQELA